MESEQQLSVDWTDAWRPLPDGPLLTTTIVVDDVTNEAIAPFDLTWDGTTRFVSSGLPAQLPKDFGIGVIVGASGSGKSTLLRRFGAPTPVDWIPEHSIASHFPSGAVAAERFAAVGLNAIPTWTKPYGVLSVGERFRADLSRILGTGTVIDEFTSVVDRNVAMSASNALRRWAQSTNARNIVIATCHRDVLPWLEPDWIIDLDIRSWALLPRGCLRRPDLVVDVYAGSPETWRIFAPHHYLDADLNPAARCFVATVNDTMFGFSAALPFPNGNLRNAWREHRTVVLPDFQGLGLGVRLSDWVANYFVDHGKRYFSRTAHPRMGQYRESSPLWRATASSQKRARLLTSYMPDEYLAFRQRTGWDAWDFDDQRVAWSHEYIGDGTAPVLTPRSAEPAVTQTSIWAMGRGDIA